MATYFRDATASQTFAKERSAIFRGGRVALKNAEFRYKRWKLMKKQPSASSFEQGIVHRGTYTRLVVDDDFIEKYNNN